MAPTRYLIVPAAGRGTRMRSVRPGLPKELLPLGSRPAIHYALEEGRDAGVESIVVILSPEKRRLRSWLESLEYPLRLCYQETPTGEADAIALAEPLVGQGSLAILYPDNVCLPSPGALRRLFAAHERLGADLLALGPVTAANETAIGHAGQVDLVPVAEDLYRIRRLAPKAAGHFRRRFPVELRACGLLVCGTHVFDVIRRIRPADTQGEFTDEAVRRCLLEEQGLLGLRLPGTVFDIGNPQGYRQCLQFLAEIRG